MGIDRDPSQRPHPGSDSTRPEAIVAQESRIIASYGEHLDPPVVQRIVREHTELMGSARIQDFGAILLERLFKQELRPDAASVSRRPNEDTNTSKPPETQSKPPIAQRITLFRAR